MVWGSHAGGSNIFWTHPDQPWGPTTLLKWVLGLFPGDEVARVWCWPPTPFSADVMYTKNYTSNSPSYQLGLLWDSLYIYPPSNTLQVHNKNQMSASKGCMQCAPDCLISHRYVQHFTHTAQSLSISLTKCLFILQLHSPLSISTLPVAT